jgi:hypothetical protein
MKAVRAVPSVSMAARRSIRGSSLRTTVRKARAMSVRMAGPVRTMATATSSELGSDVEAISQSLVRHFQCTLNEDPSTMGENAADTYRALAHAVAERLAMRFKKTQDAFVAVRVPPRGPPGPPLGNEFRPIHPNSQRPSRRARTSDPCPSGAALVAALGPLRRRENCTCLFKALVDRFTRRRWRLSGRTAAPRLAREDLRDCRNCALGAAVIAMCAHWVASYIPLCVSQCWSPPPRRPPPVAAKSDLIADDGGKVSGRGVTTTLTTSVWTPAPRHNCVGGSRTLPVSCRSPIRGARASSSLLIDRAVPMRAPPHACENRLTTR